MSDASTKHVWASPLLEVQRYSALYLAFTQNMRQNNVWFLHNTATHTCIFVLIAYLNRSYLHSEHNWIVEQVSHKLLQYCCWCACYLLSQQIHATSPHRNKHASIHVSFDGHCFVLLLLALPFQFIHCTKKEKAQLGYLKEFIDHSSIIPETSILHATILSSIVGLC